MMLLLLPPPPPPPPLSLKRLTAAPKAKTHTCTFRAENQY
jgi:hypothetical protein